MNSRTQAPQELPDVPPADVTENLVIEEALITLEQLHASEDNKKWDGDGVDEDSDLEHREEEAKSDDGAPQRDLKPVFCVSRALPLRSGTAVRCNNGFIRRHASGMAAASKMEYYVLS